MQRRRQHLKSSQENKEWLQQTSSRTTESSVRGKYHQQYRNYLNNEFTYACYEFVNRISNHTDDFQQLKDLPVRQVVLAITKMLFFNELEFLFLGCLLDEL